MSGRRRIFGFEIDPLTVAEVAGKVINEAPARGQVSLIVTPNIQHVALLSREPAFRRAYDRAALTLCDGFPVHYYALLRGVPSTGRITGCDITDAVMECEDLPEHHRLFFAVDSEITAEALREWARRKGMDDRVATVVPEFGFERDRGQSAELADEIHNHGTTILFMCVGAPKSEIFVDTHRDMLPACWALCVGQAVKMALGLVPRPPEFVKRYNLEWAWRFALEPRRMWQRYGYSISGFFAAIARDLRQPK